MSARSDMCRQVDPGLDGKSLLSYLLGATEFQSQLKMEMVDKFRVRPSKRKSRPPLTTTVNVA